MVYRLVGYLWKAQTKGEALPVESLLASMEDVTETGLANQMRLLVATDYITRSESGSWLLCRDLHNISLLDLYRSGEYYLPVNEAMEIPSKSEWDAVFFRSVSLGELNMQQSLESMYAVSDR